MRTQTLIVHPDDNVAVALEDLRSGERAVVNGDEYELLEDIPQKHKFSLTDLDAGSEVRMYGVTVGKATQPIFKGSLISRQNVTHKAGEYNITPGEKSWSPPDTKTFSNATWQGYHRSNGTVGTRNYWLVIPLVFCENRNVEVMKQSLLSQLGYDTGQEFAVNTNALIEKYKGGASTEELLATSIADQNSERKQSRVFERVDGIKFLTHEGGCGGTMDDIQNLCNLLAGYITHPNTGGATILSLGCQMAQIRMLREAIQRLDPGFDRPLEIFEQQQSRSEREMIENAVKKTFVGLAEINKLERKPAPLAALTIGLECGGSDGFSGLSANPALGHTSDLVVALGGKAILSEFPELNGVEQELINRCQDQRTAEKFAHLMRTYSQRAADAGSGFDMNPSPGNIRDGLITDAMKSAGAAKKGGTSPVADVLDYTEQADKPGLNLLCTPGNDVESTTGLAGSGANIIVFTTGLGTPTGNPISPVVKMSSNSALARRMPEIIDIDAGGIIDSSTTVQQSGEALLKLIMEIASGNIETKAEILGQDDFIPWKRGVSL